MRVHAFVLRGFCLVAIGMGAVGCSSAPSYRDDQIVESIAKICTTEYQFDVSVRKVGHTVALHLRHPGILERTGGQIRLTSIANQILGDVIESIHRVTLSSEHPDGFYIILVSDPSVPDTYLTIVRYLDDVRRVNAQSITPTEFFSRTIFELQHIQAPEINFDQIIINDIRMEDFLSWQLAHRIQDRLADLSHSHDGLPAANVGQCIGGFHEGEFVFTLNITPQPDKPFDDAAIRKVFQKASEVVAQVLTSYRFDHFDTIRFVHPSSGRNVLLPKTQLELFR